MKINREHLATLQCATRDRLLASAREEGFFEGRLSNSALAAALASFALDRGGRAEAARRGRAWLFEHQNADGGWGDTPDSPSNLATTLLTLCSLRGRSERVEAIRCAESWLAERSGGLTPERLTRAVAEFYGRDKTFSGPILSICAMSGLLGPEPEAWQGVMPLPFEAACLPPQLFKWIRLPVVSYALPALIAIGLARHRQCPTRVLPWRWLRNVCAHPALGVLRRIQPDSGGYLEAIPLTSFVALNLMAAGEPHSPILTDCLNFLEQGQGAEGGWPIDTNLATWTTSLSVRALADVQTEPDSEAWRTNTLRYLLRVRQRGIHPFTNAAPGGWGWTYLSGAVPDADDTSAALLALKSLAPADVESIAAARAGLRWLLAVQNRDGGIPTFCRGWLNLPFDRSCPDITAHALAAFSAWQPELPELSTRLEDATHRAVAYLARTQRSDGAWIPLWFGNQAAPRQENPVFGTARVVEGLTQLSERPDTAALLQTGVAWLTQAQNCDGGWGGAPGVMSSVEETSLALSALAPFAAEPVLAHGLEFLYEKTQAGRQFSAAPIGLYFSSLWYSEALYPVVFTAHAVRALGQ